jgi:uncharacterized protein DUF397
MTSSEPRIRRWCRSSFSTHGDSNCVEVATGSVSVGVRDSKNAGGGELDFPAAAWRTFLSDRRGSGQ